MYLPIILAVSFLSSLALCDNPLQGGSLDDLIGAVFNQNPGAGNQPSKQINRPIGGGGPQPNYPIGTGGGPQPNGPNVGPYPNGPIGGPQPNGPIGGPQPNYPINGGGPIPGLNVSFFI